MFSQFFLLQTSPEKLLHLELDPLLVGLSFAVGMVAVVLSMHLAQTGARVPGQFQRKVTWVSSCGTLWLGIWATHFIAMLSMNLPLDVQHQAGWHLMSALAALGAAGLIVHQWQTQSSSTGRMVAVSAAAGICMALVHYLGMAALHMQAELRYAPLAFAASLLTATFLFAPAMWIWRRMVQHSHTAQRLVLPSLALTGALTGTHYLLISAARFVVRTPRPGLDDGNSSQTLALLVAISCIALFAVLALGSAALRYRSLWRRMKRSEARLQALATTAVDAVITINGKGLVQSFNPGAERIFGWKADEIIGRNLNLLMPSPLAEQHDSYLEHYHQTGERRIIGKGREVLGMHRDGRHIPLRLSIGQADTPDGPLFVGFAYDLTERKRTEAQLRIAASVFDHTREGIAVIDANRLIAESNPAFSLLLGIAHDKCLRMPFEDLYQEVQPAIDMRSIWQAVAANGHWQGEIVMPRSDGTEWTQRLSLTAVQNEHKRLAHFVAVVSDVSLHVRPTLTMEHASLYDPLTGLPNELLLVERIAHSIPSAKRNGTQAAVISIDFDHFTRVNEVHGRGVGDELLAQMALRLRSHLRGEDTLARGNGDELVVVLAGLKDEAGLHIVLNRLRSALHLPIELSSVVMQISASCGWAIYPQDGTTAHSLLAAARTAQEKSKEAARAASASTEQPS